MRINEMTPCYACLRPLQLYRWMPNTNDADSLQDVLVKFRRRRRHITSFSPRHVKPSRSVFSDIKLG